jgi:folylpolyglutamate synthase/dihydrofolate synthase
MSIRPGLERITQLMNALGNPQTTYPIIHVAGTNGKGSTCAFLSSTLNTQYKTGSFQSPHMHTPRDAIRIQGVIVEEKIYQEAREQVMTKNEFECSPFELDTATAFLVFAKAQVELAIVEVGMGGLLDSTNVIPPPLVGVITVIGHDHQEFLGTEIESIAKHKAGIIKSGTEYVVVAPQRFPCRAVFEVQCQQKGVRMVEPTKARKHENGCIVEYCGQNVTVRKIVPGEYQLVNIAVAIAALDAISNHFPLTAENIQAGIESTRISGRLEWIDTSYGRLLVDGAHNLDGCHVLDEFLATVSRPIQFIFGLSGSRDPQHFLDIIMREGDAVFAVPFPKPEGMPWIQCQDPTEMCEKVQKWKMNPCKDVQDALRKIDPEKTVVVCGSLYLVAELYRVLEIPI